MRFVPAIFFYMETLIFLLTGILVLSLYHILSVYPAKWYHLEFVYPWLCGVPFLLFFAALLFPPLIRIRKQDRPRCLEQGISFLFVLWSVSAGYLCFTVSGKTGSGIEFAVLGLTFFFSGRFFRSLYTPDPDPVIWKPGILPVSASASAIFSLLLYLYPQMLNMGYLCLLVLLWMSGSCIFKRAYGFCKRWFYPQLLLVVLLLGGTLWHSNRKITTEPALP